MNKLIAYDLGTGGIKSSLFLENGEPVSDVFLPYETYYPSDQFAEQRPDDWWAGVCKSTKLLIQKSGVKPGEIIAAALSGHSLAAVPLDRNGSLLCTKIPIWCDMRATGQLAAFFRDLSYEDWYRTTGNGDPAECYTILKLMWLKEHQPDLFAKIHTILGSKDYINYKLTGSLCTDPSYASGFGVFNLMQWNYEDRFFDAAGITKQIFPELRPSDSIIGHVTPQASAQTMLPAGIPVACGAVDNTCMALGSTGLDKNSVYTSLGSSSWIAVTSETPVVDPATRPFVFAHVKKGYYTSAVSIFSAGNSFRWVRDQLCRDLVCDTDAYECMNQMACQVPPGSHGVLFNPSLAGGSAQEPSPKLCGGFMGLKLSNTREDLVRASMEGIAMALRKTLDLLSTQTDIRSNMLICGGGSKSAVWRQIFADIYDMPVIKTNIDQNAASLGAAALAANACGIWTGYDRIHEVHRIESRSLPNPTANAVYERLLPVYTRWTDCLAELAEIFPAK